jgi:hypothetical protein
MTRLAIVSPAPKLRFELVGRGASDGHTCRNEPVSLSVDVTLRVALRVRR